MDTDRAQELLRRLNIDGWLIYNFRTLNVIAERVLELPGTRIPTRRYFYFIPAQGKPRKLVHRIEHHILDSLPGEKRMYVSWSSLGEGLKSIMEGAQTIAMEYSQHNAIPHIARIDAGTVDLVRYIGKQVVSSAELVMEFEAALTDEQIESHVTAAKQIRLFVHNAFSEIRNRIDKAGEIKEYTVQQFLMKRFNEHNFICHHPPIVAVNEHTGNPLYRPSDTETAVIRGDNLVLIDLFARMKRAGSIFAEITWMGYTGTNVPEEYSAAFAAAARARDDAIQLIRDRFAAGVRVRGYEVDDAARTVIRNAGFGENFFHRTGHSLGEEHYGFGADIDNLETHDDRSIIPRTCFTIEPGIYTDGFGIRTQINVLITPDGGVTVTGGDPQQEIMKI